MKRLTTKQFVAAAALVGLTAGVALAHNTSSGLHQNIPLKDPSGNPIAATATTNNAFSIKQTCFGTAGCHGTASAPGNAKYTYDQIERHSYHAQLGANEFRGYNPANPDGDAWRSGAGPAGKNWVQSPGHVGSW